VGRSRPAVAYGARTSEFAAAYATVIPQILSATAPGGVEVGTAGLFFNGEQRGQSRRFAAQLPRDPPQHTTLATGQAHVGPPSEERRIHASEDVYTTDRNAVLVTDKSQAGIGIAGDQMGEDRGQAAQFGQMRGGQLGEPYLRRGGQPDPDHPRVAGITPALH